MNIPFPTPNEFKEIWRDRDWRSPIPLLIGLISFIYATLNNWKPWALVLAILCYFAFTVIRGFISLQYEKAESKEKIPNKPFYLKPQELYFTVADLCANQRFNIHMVSSTPVSLFILNPDQRKTYEKSGQVFSAKHGDKNKNEITLSFTPDESGLWGFLIQNPSEANVAKVEVKDWSLEE